jgi:predicted GNAT superfamily acetyltransferase
VARRWRETTRRAFLSYLGRGYRVAGFERAPDGSRAFYRLVPT